MSLRFRSSVLLLVMLYLQSCGKISKITSSLKGEEKPSTVDGVQVMDLPAWVFSPYIEGKISAIGISNIPNAKISKQFDAAEVDAILNAKTKLRTQLNLLVLSAFDAHILNKDDQISIQDEFILNTGYIISQFSDSNFKRFDVFQSTFGAFYLHVAVEVSDVRRHFENSVASYEAILQGHDTSRKDIEKFRRFLSDKFNDILEISS